MDSVSTVECLAFVLFFVLTAISVPRREEQRMLMEITSSVNMSHAIASSTSNEN
jgi:hypothetical protein